MTSDPAALPQQSDASQEHQSSTTQSHPEGLEPGLSAASDKTLRMSYRIGRGEQGVLTFEPYKSTLLPHWKFRTVPIAKASSQSLWEMFLRYEKEDDFVGMDMARKFIQMGMTRAKRYANHKGGRKYDANGKELEKSTGHKDMKEKEEASQVFRQVWERCKKHEGYLLRKEAFLAEQKAWDKAKKSKA
ncbi:MAG: hypothetical protein L6R42_006405 [Xanthoria sp. 1 TBL-2021]|nr:MAG: hypothetical protein L6R42_006405 [Xanthoria sp. 1 TBL-2021]